MSLDSCPVSPSTWSPLVRPVRFLLYWLIKALVLLYLGGRFILRPRAVRYGLLALLVVGSVAWKSVGASAHLPWSTDLAHQSFSTTAVVEPLAAPAVVEQYLKAQAEFDAGRMWETMNDRLKRRMMTTNNTQEKLQQELDNARAQGRRYDSATFMGGVPLDGGFDAYFYVLAVDGSKGRTLLPYTFIVDGEGKITNIQWSLDR